MLYELLLGRIHLFLTEDEKKDKFLNYSPNALQKCQSVEKGVLRIEALEGQRQKCSSPNLGTIHFITYVLVSHFHFLVRLLIHGLFVQYSVTSKLYISVNENPPSKAIADVWHNFALISMGTLRIEIFLINIFD